MRYFLTVSAVFAIAVISAVGLNQLLGEENTTPSVAQMDEEFDPDCEIPPELLPAPGATSPDNPPPSTPEPPGPDTINLMDILPAKCFKDQPYPVGVEPDKGPTIFIGGEEVPLPDGVSYSSVISDPGPNWNGDEPLYSTIIEVGKSFLQFADDILLESHVEPKDAATLEPILEKLTPRDHYDLPDGTRISLPANVSFNKVYPGTRVGKEYPGDYPSFFMMVEAGNSWVHFDENKVIIGSHIEPQDAEALQPVIDQLRPR